MATPVEEGTLSFSEFWRWLRKHPNCILRAGTPDAVLYDHEPLHWHLDNEPDGNPVVQLVWGKVLMAELIMDVRDALYVQSMPDPDDPQGEHFMFEVIGSVDDEAYPMYRFVLAHAFDEDRSHAVGIKH